MGKVAARAFSYDRLVIGTGGVSLVPNLPGIDLPGVFFLRWMADSFAFQEYLTSRRPTSIVIIGAGYIGMEMADAMTRRGLSVTVVEFLPSVLTTFDPALGGIVRTELELQGVQVFNGFAVERIESKGNRLSVRSVAGDTLTADMVLVAVGSRPETALARSAGIETGVKGAVSRQPADGDLYPGYLRSRRLRGDLSPAAWEKHLSALGHHRP